MSKPIEHVEIITSRERRRLYSAQDKVRLIEQIMQPGMTVSAVARLHGLISFGAQPPSPPFQWRRRMADGGRRARGCQG